MDDVRDEEEAERLVLELITQNAESLLRVARRYSYCADDAQDAYQRAMEILMRHARRLDRARAAGWLHTVVKHEALAVRAQRSRSVGSEEVDFDRVENRTTPSPEDRVLSLERVAQTAEALQRVKANEAKAMWLKASGDSYAEISERTGWTYTKVNRCLAEGRRSFLERFAGIESGEECRRWEPVLSAIVDGEADAEAVMEARLHLRHCPACRATMRQLRLANRTLAVLLPAAGSGAALAGPSAAGEHAAGVLVRVYEWIVTGFGDRAATGVLRAQAVVDAATSHKLAAVAASAAAMAGGGVAVERAVTTDRPGIARAADSTSPPPSAATAAAATSTTVVRPPLRTEPTMTPARSTTTPRTGRTAGATNQAGSDASSAQTELLVDPVESQAADPPPTPGTTTPPAPPSPSPSPSPASTPPLPPKSQQPTAHDEFGFESK
jgi:RNA polymerase sigma factor (sigma-70 family)